MKKYLRQELVEIYNLPHPESYGISQKKYYLIPVGKNVAKYKSTE